MRTIDKIITKKSGRYGAPMGRPDVGTFPPTVTSGPNCRITKKHNKNNRVFDCAVPMSADSAYDKGGVYWGIGPQLRVMYTKDLSFIRFYRLNPLFTSKNANHE